MACGKDQPAIYSPPRLHRLSSLRGPWNSNFFMTLESMRILRAGKAYAADSTADFMSWAVTGVRDCANSYSAASPVQYFSR
jgi:hypothetical protein